MNQPIFSSLPKKQLSLEMSQHIFDVEELILNSRFLEAVHEGFARYPVFRTLRFAATGSLDSIFESLAEQSCFRAHRLNASSVILDHDQALVSARGGLKSYYCSFVFDVWAENVACAEVIIKAIQDSVGSRRITDAMFSINWHFLSSKNELANVAIEELANDELLDEAYPAIHGGVQNFIDRYLDSKDTVLVLQGPPGTGKTRLIRGILGAMSRRKQDNAQAIYTGDGKTLESDEIFVKFITGPADAFVIEDADHMLKPRADGNQNLHRFLTIADGVVRAQERKIIFSTNLPNVGDLDEALIRPGRCFAHIFIRLLLLNEARQLLECLCGADAAKVNIAYQSLLNKNCKEFSLAEIYQASGL